MKSKTAKGAKPESEGSEKSRTIPFTEDDLKRLDEPTAFFNSLFELLDHSPGQ